jgi:hypothetical protein
MFEVETYAKQNSDKPKRMFEPGNLLVLIFKICMKVLRSCGSNISTDVRL